MPNRFANGVRAIAMCDRCGQQYKLKNLKTEIIKQRKYELLVCPECWDPDQPQLMLGTFPVEDPQALRNPRKDNTYITAGQNNDGVPTGGSRDIQWGWNPVGGSKEFDDALTPNNLVGRTSVGNVTISVDGEPTINLFGVSATGAVGNALGPLAITGVQSTGAVGSVFRAGTQTTGVSSTTGTGYWAASIGMTFDLTGAQFDWDGTNAYFYYANNSSAIQAQLFSIANYLTPNNSSGYTPLMNLFLDASTTNPPPVGTPLNSFGYTVGRMFSTYAWIQWVLAYPGQPAPPPGTYYVKSTLQSVTEFVIPCPQPDPGHSPPGAPMDGYNPVYAQVGPNSSLTWTGTAAASINGLYQQYGSQVGKKVYVGWINNGYPYTTTEAVIGTVTSINYDTGTQTFTVNMLTSTPMTPLIYTISPFYFLSINT